MNTGERLHPPSRPSPHGRYPVGRVYRSREVIEYLLVNLLVFEKRTISFSCRQGGFHPSPLADDIRWAGFTGAVPVSESSRFREENNLIFMQTGGCRPLNPRRRYQAGRVDWDLRRSTHSPIQSLSPFGGAPQRQRQAKRCPGECLRAVC